jgi:adenine phosphoribosyltransferase
MAADRTYRTRVGSQEIELPVVAIAEDLAIALLISVDHGIEFAARAGRELAEQLAPFGPEIVVSVATMGIPLAIEVTRALGLDDYLILHKTPKIHLGDSLAEPVRSITTDAVQRLRMDPARAKVVEGRRVAVVDDVVSTGASLLAALNLLRRVGAEPVVVGTLVTEASGWREALGADAELVRALGSIPVFLRLPDGQLEEFWGAGGGGDAPTER